MQTFHIRYRNTQGTLMRVLNADSRRALDLPVVKAEPPLSLAEVVGTVTERDLLETILGDPSAVDAPVADVMGPPLPMVGSGEPIGVASNRLAESAAVLVLDNGHPTGIVTRSDLLDFLSGPSTR